MNDAGEIVCGIHGRPYCGECSDEARKLFGIDVAEEPTPAEKISAALDDLATKDARAGAQFPSMKKPRGAAAIRGPQR